MKKYFIVKFPDGYFTVFPEKPERSQFGDGAELFRVDESATVVDISHWIASMYSHSKRIERIQWD